MIDDELKYGAIKCPLCETAGRHTLLTAIDMEDDFIHFGHGAVEGCPIRTVIVDKREWLKSDTIQK